MISGMADATRASRKRSQVTGLDSMSLYTQYMLCSSVTKLNGTGMMNELGRTRQMTKANREMNRLSGSQ